MEDEKKEEGFVDKAVDFLNDTGDKITDFAKEHEFDEKVDKATAIVERGFKNAFESLKGAFGKKD